MYIVITIAIATLLPSLVFAAVVVQSTTSVTPSAETGPIYFAEGPDYADASSLGFATWTSATSTTQEATLTVGYVNNATYTELVDVLEVVNHTGKNLLTNIELSVNTAGSATTPTVYYSSTAYTALFPTESDLGTALTTSGTGAIHITSSGAVEYISIYLPPSTGTTSVTISLTYEIG
jgi:hypothetical protein